MHVDEVSPGRWNVVGVAEGEPGGPTRMLCGHTDTVGVEGMTAPFAPEIRDGRLYGRGSQDMKSGVAAMLAAAAAWAASDRRGAGRVIVAGVADEDTRASAPRPSPPGGRPMKPSKSNPYLKLSYLARLLPSLQPLRWCSPQQVRNQS